MSSRFWTSSVASMVWLSTRCQYEVAEVIWTEPMSYLITPLASLKVSENGSLRSNG